MRTAVTESAERIVKIQREGGKTTIAVTMSGRRTTTLTLRQGCTVITTVNSTWSNAGNTAPVPGGLSIDIAPDGSYKLGFESHEEEHTKGGGSTTQTGDCPTTMQNSSDSPVELDWPVRPYTIVCPSAGPRPWVSRRSVTL